MDEPAADPTRRLAAGLAHDINNLLNAFVGYGELLRTGLAGDPDLLPFAEGIVDACRRGARLSHQLAVLGGRVRARRRPVDLASLVAGLADPDAEVPLAVGALAPVQVVVDPALLAEALVLAAEHARRCLPHGPRLTLVVRDDPPAVELRLAARLPADARDRLWEPFALPRAGGRGSLLLASAAGLVALCGGACAVAEGEDGDALRFTLPAVAGLPLAGRTVVLQVADEEHRLQLEAALGAAGALVHGPETAGLRPLAVVSDQPLPRASPYARLRRLPAGSPPDVVAALAVSAGG